ncbi:hypothetical protein PSN45_004092 [Yamadazyma tenuis]|uniref:Peptide N-acetyl-beta-D-glucosaminyl asparaginase amidase A N-terminal domain-containing protein n=1 Tax=Candida tenuis (strain ATCC 10573 / BCRC 21748 / CBS 615 / JCM 9827 / NBRC 10315 / NRRL Y-1498 / VKM Y-70) TaxID=590646 RepID=G3B4I2_CANTC|nr:uncharacterized protein CANTEDRAFT_93344 [Yamadazyma tenuis ATCC 10573]EGV63837.1 hypothetical protein CANTEDRAFT_93344 [Yamadazyma tenuis ATCC 10573]WEJ96553.1 hypothetical protein PSN45_004092 [Yamadazyma tenuis]
MAIELSEKDELLQHQLDLELNKPIQKKSRARAFANGALASFTGLLVVLYFLRQSPAVECFSPFAIFASVFAPVAPAPITVEVFEVSPDLTLSADAYVLNTTVFNQTLSDGIAFDYEAPVDFNFTGAFLTLNFSNEALVAGKPVVAEISVDDTPVWRTSTPYSKLNTITQSSTVKNVTELLSLFTEDKSISINFLEGSAAATDVVLVLSLYNDTLTAAPVAKTPITVEDILSAHGPADIIFPLTNAGKPFKLPTDSFSVTLPQLESNVTVAKVSLFASATEEEITYFKNDIGKIGEPASSGPLRYINVYVNDVYISSIAPKPALFHANEVSDNANITSLWQPLADVGAFQGLTYEVDLVSVLPFLWADDANLVVEVVSPVGAANKAPGVPPVLAHPVIPGENVITTGSWFVSGNLLAWESSLISSAVGEVLIGESSEKDSGVVVEPPMASPFAPSIKTEIVKSFIDAGIISELNFTLLDNSTANYTVEFNSSTHSILSKHSKSIKTIAGPPGSGAGTSTTTSTLTLITGIKNNFAILDVASGIAVFTKNETLDFPLNYNESAVDKKVAFVPPSTSSKLTFSIGSKAKLSINGLKTSSYKVKESASLDDIIGTTTDVKVEIETVGELPYSREVEATNGVITKDTSVA